MIRKTKIRENNTLFHVLPYLERNFVWFLIYLKLVIKFIPSEIALDILSLKTKGQKVSSFNIFTQRAAQLEITLG